MYTDPIADLLTRVRNAHMAEHKSLNVPHSNLKEEILKVMKRYGFIENIKVSGDKKKEIEVTLKTDGSKLNLRRVSKPGQRIYRKNDELRKVKSGLGINILSTSKGILSNIEAKKENIGGEVLCEISH